MMVPRLMASSMGKSVSPGTYRKQVKQRTQACKERADPTILHGLSPALAVLADADNDIEAVVTSVETLAMTLGAVADDGEGVIFEVVVQLGEGPVGAFVDDLVGARKAEGLHTARRECLCTESESL